MTRIGLLSDTHHFLDVSILHHFAECDEIWHAGDFGNIEVANSLEKLCRLRGVYGNIDGKDIRSIYPERLIWTCEKVKIIMTHIGGYPP